MDADADCMVERCIRIWFCDELRMRMQMRMAVISVTRLDGGKAEGGFFNETTCYLLKGL